MKKFQVVLTEEMLALLRKRSQDSGRPINEDIRRLLVLGLKAETEVKEG